MARYKVTLAYDGTGYYGFQKQRNPNTPTIQGCIEKALRELGWSKSSILAAGRTDTGVHALGQVIAFDLNWQHPASDLLAAMNAHLPVDISLCNIEEVCPDFHPRFQAVCRRYMYHIFCQSIRNPLRERYAWRVWPEIEIAQMQYAATLIEGLHDFAAFGTPPGSKGTTIRFVEKVSWQWWKDAMDQKWLVFDISANAFLFHMVRRMVSFFIGIGQGKHEAKELGRLLERPPVHPIQGLAPPQGLVLVEVNYPP
ncbi:MAG: tRNA pseudouridine(38-40) synthase TruA [Anaerolineales bacterium]|nr:tRNA pseudouridine(38-40) synthase TruA [Anaerolineales bacterium]